MNPPTFGQNLPFLTILNRCALGQSLVCWVETFIYRCPNTGRNVQGWLADDPTADDDTFEAMACLACSRMHLVNRSGTVLGAEGQDES